MTHDPALEAARRRRKHMHTAMIDVEEALQAPSRSSAWGPRLLTELGDLLAALENHASTVDAPDGIIARVVNDAPRLDGLGKRLTADHDVLREGVKTAMATVESSGTPASTEEANAIREQVVDLLARFTRHRHQGSDFIWEAYDVEIGGPG
jgi:hypothetical protein